MLEEWAVLLQLNMKTKAPAKGSPTPKPKDEAAEDIDETEDIDATQEIIRDLYNLADSENAEASIARAIAFVWGAQMHKSEIVEIVQSYAARLCLRHGWSPLALQTI